jgi:hypothetical protein
VIVKAWGQYGCVVGCKRRYIYKFKVPYCASSALMHHRRGTNTILEEPWFVHCEGLAAALLSMWLKLHSCLYTVHKPTPIRYVMP